MRALNITPSLFSVIITVWEKEIKYGIYMTKDSYPGVAGSDKTRIGVKAMTRLLRVLKSHSTFRLYSVT